MNLQFSSGTVLVTDAITLELFLKTKNANHFNFYQKNVGAGAVSYTHLTLPTNREV